ncbi:MAG TPA: cyclic nucleotide-binding domain-containing protein [Acetobacteraceae bacterium]|nr:cyclic nucleotide-binding domain-containing protein [Acetobacteraceae bacterium]
MRWDLIYHHLIFWSWRDLPGYVGALLVIASFVVRTMIPLRALSAASNLCFMLYAYYDAQYPTLFLHAMLLPLNVLRMVQMMKLVRRVRGAALGSKTMDWLKPYMTHRRCRRGEIIFHKGDVADAMYYIVSGHFRLPEIAVHRMPGEFVGELGLLAPEGQRTQTLECVEEGEVLAIRYDEVRELFFQNPDFGFYFMQLAAGRLFHALELMEQELARQTARADAPYST